MLTTFCLALSCLTLVCEAGTDCYSYYASGAPSYVCTNSLSLLDRFGIAYGTFAGIGLLVSLIIYVACKGRQRRQNNAALYLQAYPNVAYSQLGQHFILIPHSANIQTPAPQPAITNPVILLTNQQPATPQNTITNTTLPFSNQHLQTPGTESASAVTRVLGPEGRAERLTVMLPETQKDEDETDNPPPYSA